MIATSWHLHDYFPCQLQTSWTCAQRCASETNACFQYTHALQETKTVKCDRRSVVSVQVDELLASTWRDSSRGRHNARRTCKELCDVVKRDTQALPVPLPQMLTDELWSKAPMWSGTSSPPQGVVHMCRDFQHHCSVMIDMHVFDELPLEARQAIVLARSSTSCSLWTQLGCHKESRRVLLEQPGHRLSAVHYVSGVAGFERQSSSIWEVPAHSFLINDRMRRGTAMAVITFAQVRTQPLRLRYPLLTQNCRVFIVGMPALTIAPDALEEAMVRAGTRNASAVEFRDIVSVMQDTCVLKACYLVVFLTGLTDLRATGRRFGFRAPPLI